MTVAADQPCVDWADKLFYLPMCIFPQLYFVVFVSNTRETGRRDE